MKGEKMYSIAELAKEFGVTPRTIRYYEEMGLLSSRRKNLSQQRLYDAKSRARLKLILRGKRFGFSLREIKEMIELYDVDPTQKEQLKHTIAYGDKKIEEIDEKIAELQEIKMELIEFREHFEELLKKLENKKGGLNV
ncbi:MAG: MerR family DNA-binding transcriptional regulator [Flexistipes sinusarabici]|uniref:MerR family DNA-binding transcriptional regulator n=1 Tax=Flexistipes sinusarabici TaxID=2352 RepID=A0A5D0MNN3_FLESI|nr:MerR family DNA-binding transcriptional regulator [Flexistipes sinusarabici]TYB33565.1 MAG: MerR family DNA-binding transcriptional regulator [Flexistipes sinusarabici]